MKINLTIDGKKAEVDSGASILDAARKVDIEIPTFCDHKDLMPFGSCRICVVEDEGTKRLFASCVTPATDGMVIKTDTEQVKEAREAILELLLTYHPLDCPVCPQSGRCDLQDLAFIHGKEEGRFAQGDAEKKIDLDSPLIEMNENRCILCGRCVRICNEVQGEGQLDFVGRGFPTAVEPAFGRAMDCEFCGQCIQACPVGALYSRVFKHTTPAWELKPVRTTCPFCGVGCTLDLEVKGDRIYHVLGVDDEGSINNGHLCSKGRFGYEYVGNPERLKVPMVRKGDTLVEATWEEAYDKIVSGLTKIKDQAGPDAIGGIASARCTNEDNYLFQKFMRAAVGTNNVDSVARFGHLPAMEALRKAFGTAAPTDSMADIEKSDLIFALDANITEDANILGLKVLKRVRYGDGKLIVANPRKIKLTKFADTHLRHRPGSGVALLNSIINVILEEGLEDSEFVGKHVSGLDELKASVADAAPEKMEQHTGIDAAQLRETARSLAASPALTLLLAPGLTNAYTGEDTVAAAANLLLITGNIGKPGAGIIPISEYNNIQGIMDMGAMPESLPGYQAVSDSGARGSFEDIWKATLPSEKGLDANGMIQAAADGKLKSMFVMGEDPLSSFPDRDSVAGAMEKLDLLVVQDIFLTETAKIADVVLPASCGPEKNGTFTNTDRRVQRVRKAINAPKNTRDDWKIISELSSAMGYEMVYPTAMDVLREIAGTVPVYAGILPERLEKTGLHWPCTEPDHPGTETLYENGFPGGSGNVNPVQYQAPGEKPADSPYLLLPGTLLYHSGTTTTKATSLNDVAPTAVAEVNSQDARDLGLTNGDWVRLKGARGSIELQAKVDDRNMQGTVFVPTHYSDTSVNALLSDEPVKEKGLTFVSIEKIEPVGADAQG